MSGPAVDLVRYHWRCIKVFARREMRLWMHFRFSFGLDGLMVLTNVVIYMTMASFRPAGPGLAVYGTDYASFLIVGLAVNTILAASLAAPYSGLLATWQANRLELMLMSPINLPLFVASISVGGYLRAGFRVLVYLAIGLVFGACKDAAISMSGLVSALLALFLATIACLGLGLMAASMVYFVDARGGSDPVRLVVEALAGIAAGVYFPVVILPQWLQFAACVVPHTYALDTVRRGLFGGTGEPALIVHAAGLSPIATNLIILSVYAGAAITAGVWLFGRGLELGRQDGRLSMWR